MRVEDLGRLAYREAWARQEQAHARVQQGGEEVLFLVEHPPVITFGRRPGAGQHLLASADQLARIGVEVVQSDRGGDITFHGPGQIVAYPIVRLADRGLLAGSYVRRLLGGVIAALGDFGLEARLDPGAIGVWVPLPGHIRPPVPTTGDEPALAKICALGVRIRRGISLHGIALNVTTDLRFFNLIVPCGLTRPVTSMQQVMGERLPPLERIKAGLVQRLGEALGPGCPSGEH